MPRQPVARREPIYRTAISTGMAVLRFLRVKKTVSGIDNLPDRGGAVLAMTHFGYLEFVLVEWAAWTHNRRRIRFLATSRAFDTPVVGWALRGMRHIPVDMAAGAGAYSTAVESLRAGELVGVFPEAGVSSSFEVRQLKTGAARLAAEAGVPVIPVAVWGGQRLLTKNRRIRARERFGIPVSFAIGDPIPVSPEDDPSEVSESLRTTLQTLVHRLQADYPDEGTGQWWQPRSLGGTAPTPEEAAAADEERARRRAAKGD